MYKIGDGAPKISDKCRIDKADVHPTRENGAHRESLVVGRCEARGSVSAKRGPGAWVVAMGFGVRDFWDRGRAAGLRPRKFRTLEIRLRIAPTRFTPARAIAATRSMSLRGRRWGAWGIMGGPELNLTIFGGGWGAAAVGEAASNLYQILRIRDAESAWGGGPAPGASSEHHQ